MILALDTETGGLGVEFSLLQIALVVADDKYNVVDKLTLNVRPNAGKGRSTYIVESEALQINKIDLANHLACDYKDAAAVIYSFLDYHSTHGRDKLILTGKNVHGDVYQVWDKLISRGSWENFVSYQWMDLSAIWKFLVLQGIMPDLGKSSLSALCEHFGIKTDNLHNAEADCMYTLECLKRISGVLKAYHV